VTVFVFLQLGKESLDRVGADGRGVRVELVVDILFPHVDKRVEVLKTFAGIVNGNPLVHRKVDRYPSLLLSRVREQRRVMHFLQCIVEQAGPDRRLIDVR
jgi:hypothetical protein